MMFIPKNVFMNENGGDGGDGGGAGSSLEQLQATLESQNAELERLRQHSSKLLDEKKKIQQDFKKYEALGDPEQISNILKHFENNEDAKLVAEGKFDEVLAKHTQRQQLDYEEKINNLSSSLEEQAKAADKYKNMFHESQAGHAIRAAAEAAGVRSTAVEDILLRGKGVFTVSDDGTLEARDKDGNLVVANGKPLSPDLFVAGLKDKYPHYWPDSQGSGANGGNGVGQQVNPFKKGSKDYNVTEQAKLRRTNPELADQLAKEAEAAK
jgi:hypothetical protein